MKFKKSSTLCNFDIFPKVLTEGKKAVLNIVNLGSEPTFVPGEKYEITISGLEGGNINHYPASADFSYIEAICNEKGGFCFEHTFKTEQEYRVRVFGKNPEGQKADVTLSVYCVKDDLVGRYPFRGDLHMHTCFSDGDQMPETVAAVYRSYGYDFLAITDHHRYYPSLRAIEFYKDIPTEYTLVPGEEVHLPEINGQRADAHIVNFGGEYSINSLIEGIQTNEVGKDKKFRSVRDDCPEVMTQAEFSKKMLELAETVNVPENVDALPAAVFGWIFDEIRKADGLGIFAHPTWITGNTFHVPDALNDYFVKNKLFDAFEVLGGESYFEQNGYQTIRYYEDKAKGYHYPIVGSTDSHCCYYYNQKSQVCSTIVFSPENERKALINSIKDFYSTAVDTISDDFRVVGDMRLVRYSCFLLKNYFPFHDELCFEEGRLMAQYANGTEEEKKDVLKTLEVINGRVRKLREKYFDF